jgi:hypothetical protein
MAVADVMTFWKAFITALLKCVAALGFTVPSRDSFPAASGPAAHGPSRDLFPAALGPAAPRSEATRDGAMTFPSPRPFGSLRDRGLPPTMKQRIHAEAHGASPADRSLPGDIADSTPAVNSEPEDRVPSARRREWVLRA